MAVESSRPSRLVGIVFGGDVSTVRRLDWGPLPPPPATTPTESSGPGVVVPVVVRVVGGDGFVAFTFGCDRGVAVVGTVGSTDSGEWDEESVRPLSPRWLTFPARQRVGALAAGGAHVVAITTDGAAWAWGCSRDGRLGLGVDGGDAGDADDGGMVVDPRRMALTVPVVSAAAGRRHTLLLSAAGAVLACGFGGRGQCGTRADVVDDYVVPTPTPVLFPPSVPGATASQIAAGWQHSACVLSTGVCLAWGWNLYSQCAQPALLKNQPVPAVVPGLADVGGFAPSGAARGIAQVDCGAWHTVAVCHMGDVYAWGWGKFGALGCVYDDLRPERDAAGLMTCMDSAREHVPRLVEALADVTVVRVAAGVKHSLAIDSQSRAWVWGLGCVPTARPRKNSKKPRVGGDEAGGDGGDGASSSDRMVVPAVIQQTPMLLPATVAPRVDAAACAEEMTAVVVITE